MLRPVQDVPLITGKKNSLSFVFACRSIFKREKSILRQFLLDTLYEDGGAKFRLKKTKTNGFPDGGRRRRGTERRRRGSNPPCCCRSRQLACHTCWREFRCQKNAPSEFSIGMLTFQINFRDCVVPFTSSQRTTTSCRTSRTITNPCQRESG